MNVSSVFGDRGGPTVEHSTAKHGIRGLGEEIATAIAFLLSDDASYITGAHLAVDGGFLA